MQAYDVISFWVCKTKALEPLQLIESWWSFHMMPCISLYYVWTAAKMAKIKAILTLFHGKLQVEPMFTPRDDNYSEILYSRGVWYLWYLYYLCVDIKMDRTTSKV